MAFLTVGEKTPGKKHRLYLMKFIFDDCPMPVFKIGKSSGDDSIERLQQVTRDHYMKFRYFPQSSIKRDRPAENAFELEAMLHRAFKMCKYIPMRKFDGCTEMFIVPEDVAIKTFEMAMDGTNFDDFDPYEPDYLIDGMPLGVGFYEPTELEKEVARLTELLAKENKIKEDRIMACKKKSGGTKKK